MPAGLQVFNSSGNLIGNYTNYYGRHLGTIWTGDYPANSFYDAKLLEGTPWYMLYSSSRSQGDMWGVYNISISGGSLSWEKWSPSNNNYIIYGIY